MKATQQRIIPHRAGHQIPKLLSSLFGLRNFATLMFLFSMLLEEYYTHDQGVELLNGHRCVSFYIVRQSFPTCNVM